MRVLESALSGWAPVLGDIESLREVWGDAAAYVDRDEVGGLVAAIENLAQDDLVRAAMGDAARARALSLFSAEGMARRYAALYRELVSRRSVGASRRLAGPPLPPPTDDGCGAVQPCV